ncbi:cytochrome P450 [Aspergillus bertholletiae]|uniref:Cytochrome P450 n=1 Tax=Aspergillus bertholletiae TaxID=1226010 RepID=A0A5N7BBM4_9EURO|nr:cytochrome P450 [Aspergillus bertholletiae]
MELIVGLWLLAPLLFLYAPLGRLIGLNKSKRPLPPGPTLLSGPFPEKDIAKTFQKWNKKYGPIVSAKVGAQQFIILGSRRAAQDLLERRASIYSSRPASKFLDKYLHKGLSSAFMPYGAQWRLHRRLGSSLLSERASIAYRQLQDFESKRLLHEFLSTNDFSDAFLSYTSDIMFTLVYGKGRGKDDSDHKMLYQINEMATFVLQKASFGTILLDLFPMLDWLPHRFLTWRKKAEDLHYKTKEVYTECGNIALGGDCWNWSHEVSQRSEAKELPWEDVCYALGELYVAGIHTTKMVLEILIMVCVLHTEVKQKAQAELDSIVGEDRLPSPDDLEKLPYIRAIVSELLRWRPISPIGVPHAVTQDDEYMGYRIPAGATVVANQFGMNMDEATFDNPTAFNPDRYLDNPSLPVSAFGFGRRICPGHRLARGSLLIVTSRLLWAYDITSAQGDASLSDESSPSSVKAVFQPRSPKHEQVIKKEWEDSDKDEKQILSRIRDRI